VPAEPGTEQDDRTQAQHRHLLTEEGDEIGYVGQRARSVRGEPSLQRLSPWPIDPSRGSVNAEPTATTTDTRSTSPR
jgi:hypothetical protein